MANGDKVERKYLAHYIDTAFDMTYAACAYSRLGKDLEEYSIEMNPDSETVKNILGENSTNVKGYEPQSSVETYYAREGDALYEKLEKIINDRSTGTALETTVVDVLITASGTVKWAYREDAVIIPQSIGGGTVGVNTPFEVHYNGSRIKGTFNVDTKTFTPEGVSE